MEISIEKLDELFADGGKVLMSEGAEGVLVQLIELKQQITEAEKLIKQKLEAKALELVPNFTSIEGQRVSVRYQSTGFKYEINPGDVPTLPPNLYKLKYSPITAEIDAFRHSTGYLPEGIIERERGKTIALILRKP